jgi:helicase MOV-10
MRLLVELEELQQHIDITRYSMRGVELEVSGRRYLALQVPGLAENRPSVLKGDALYVRPHESPDSDTEFQGFVHEVRREEVLLRFNAGFHQIHINGRKWDVRFSIKRSTFVFLHEALSLLQEGRTRGEMVLPPGVVVSSVTGWRPMEVRRGQGWGCLCWRLAVGARRGGLFCLGTRCAID